MIFVAIAFLVLVLLVAFLIAAKKAASAKSGDGSYPYVKRETLLTPAERSFFGVLEQAVAGSCRICVQVRLADLLVPRKGLDRSAHTSARNRVERKHADFVLCRPDTLGILCAIELDDASHEKKSRKERDNFVEAACRAAGLPLFRFSAKASYQVQEVRSILAEVLGQAEGAVQEAVASQAVAPEDATKPSAKPAHGTSAPACPKCGGGTVLRTVKAGAHAGNRLWGCKNYPACRGYVPANT